MILGDYHTHTVFSHGKSKIEENVKVAREKGLKEIAITDHGLRHVAFGMRKRDIPKMRKIIDELNTEYDDIKVLFGIEANIYCKEGLIDVKDEQLAHFDLVAAGFHKTVWPKNIGQAFGHYGRAYRHNYLWKRKSDIDYFTKTYIKAVRSGKIDMITHLGYVVSVDVKEVGKAAADYGVLIELNGKRINLTDEEILTLADVGVSFIVNSDAHFAKNVGEFADPLATVERLGIDKSKVVNWDRLPVF